MITTTNHGSSSRAPRAASANDALPVAWLSRRFPTHHPMAATLHLDSTARRRFGSHVLKEPKSPKTDAVPLVQHEAWLQNGRQRGRIASFLKPYGLLQFL